MTESKNDNLLGIFVSMCNKFDAVSFGITLNVQGQIIVGEIIGRTEYLKELSESFRSANNGQSDLGKTIGDSFEYALEGLQKEKSEEDQEEPEPNFIHLKNVQFHPLNMSAPVWRGKLSSVDGFILGKLESN